MKINDQSATLMLPDDYIKHATNLINQAKRRVFVICLNINYADETNDFIDALLNAAERGVEVHVGADLLSFVCDHNTNVASRVAGKEMIRTSRMRSRFVKAGANFHWLGIQKVPYLIGRTHSKWTIIDDDVFSFGGVNLSHAAIAERTDYMIHIKDSKIADRLCDEQIKIEKPSSNKRPADSTAATSYGSLIIDTGKFGQSTIYKHATKLAIEAEEVLFVSQYCPTGKLGKAIKSKRSRVYFNPKGSAGDVVNNFMIGPKSSVENQDNKYTRNRYLHAKFIIGTLPDGTKRAITGSHNFASISGHMGTREVALETTDPSIIQQLEKFFEDHIK